MQNKYPNLLSPFKVGDTIFRNRLFSAPMTIHSLQGGEPFPTDAIMETFANKARGGAAMVTLAGVTSSPSTSDGEHLSYDIYTAYTRHYLAQLADAVHLYGARASMEINGAPQEINYVLSRVKAGRDADPVLDITEEIMDEFAEGIADRARLLQYLGYDMVLLHMAYRRTLGARFLSPATNRRTDKYGGSVENRARFPMMVFDRIKQKCGKNFLIELRMSGSEPIPNGITIDDSKQLARLLEGHIDLLHVHAGEYLAGHPLGFLPPTPNLALAEAIKESGTTIPVVTIGGNQDLDESESIIASGKADFISMARGWIADPDLGVKAYEGRGEDLVPCIKCNRCHDSATRENRTYVCSVNPTIGLEHRLEKIIKPATARKKVAVIGGGPSGMQAALIAESRGHDVTLFEKKNVLGGQLCFSDHVSFKYSLSKYKRYMIRQIEKSSVKVCINTEANARLLAGETFDVVISALGAEPIVPSIPGVDSKNVTMAPEVFGNEANLDTKVVVIGGGQVGCETSLHLAMCGHEITLIEMRDKLAYDASPLYYDGLTQQIEANEKLRYILNACCTSIGKEVTYKDAENQEHKLEAGTVVIAMGMRSKLDEAMALYDNGDRLVLVGDCLAVGNVEKAIRTAFGASILI